MLQIKGIRKVYKTGSLVQAALKDVSLSLRDSEFVAVLGQSGSGKTTLLNIIGGLDRYDEGDLIINGISTKRYSDRDWDSYRNHTIGFVFQSYNLIPHQTVLKNVELALTISGVNSKTRTARAKEALEKVGLSEHMHKKPSQLSGGQMQRVAIARALVNDPDILLADEPTGALDSETSLQVMDLLKEVAQDRLVVMVTHNPDLAERYATRIVTLKDGEITSDSDPFEPEEVETVHKNLGRSSMSLLTSLVLSFNNLWTKKARTILVAFAGSIGIIGIALILAMSTGANEYIRSVEEDSLKDYPLQITDTSFNLTSMYAMGAGAENGAESASATADQKPVKEWNAVTSLLSGISSNDLKSLRAYFESDQCDIHDYAQAIDYDYNITPRIYKENETGYRQVNPDSTFETLGFSSTESGNSLLSTFMSTDSFFPMPETPAMFQKDYDIKAGKWPETYNECVVSLTANGMVSDMTLYLLGLKDSEELDSMVNAFAEGEKYEGESTSASYDYEDFIGIELKLLSPTSLYTYDKKYKIWSDRSNDKKFVQKQLKNAETLKVVGVVQPISSTKSSATDVGICYPASLTKHVIRLAADSDIVKAQLKTPDVNIFTGKRFDDENENSDVDMGKLFSVDENAVSNAFSFKNTGLDLSNFDLSGVDFSNIDLSDAVSAEDITALMPQISADDAQDLLSGIRFNMTSDAMKTLFTKLLEGYKAYTADDARANISAMPSAVSKYLATDEAKAIIRSQIESFIAKRSSTAIRTEDLTAVAESYLLGYSQWLTAHNFEATDYSHISEYVNSAEAKAILENGAAAMRTKLSSLSPTDDEINAMTAQLLSGYEAYADDNSLPSASYLLTSFGDYLATDEAKALIASAVGSAIDTSALTDGGNAGSQYSELITRQMGAVINKVMAAVGSKITAALQKSMGSLTAGISQNLTSAFSFNTDSLANLFKSEMDAEELRDLMVSLMSTQKSSLDANLRKLGYADLEKPSTITIYPKDFDSKQHIKDLISAYNERMNAKGEDDKVIEYTDLVDALMGSVTQIINAISYILIAFVAISLIVSSIMIGVITYISVLERKKEIGILRAIGASKRNISRVFNAETFIIGALAGLIGIGLTELLILPGNLILHSLTEQENINAILPFQSAGILVLLSIALTLIGGIIPSRKAAKSDPVTALRAE